MTLKCCLLSDVFQTSKEVTSTKMALIMLKETYVLEVLAKSAEVSSVKNFPLPKSILLQEFLKETPLPLNKNLPVR